MRLTKTVSLLASLALGSTMCANLTSVSSMIQAQAEDIAYPVQYFRLGMFDTNQNVNASDTSLVPSGQNGLTSEKWSLNYISSGVFEIVNASNGYVLTAVGNSVTLSADADLESQRWNIEGVEKDFDGYDLYYKITSNLDSSIALTYQENSGFQLASYSATDYQKYKLNLDGLEGFAGNCMTDSGEKAGTIGGLLGEVVYVSNADDLVKQLDSVEPKTVVVTADIDLQKYSHTRIRDNKTLVGCYGNHTIYDSYFRTNNEYGKDEPSDNIIIRNLKLIAKNVPNRILINVWSSRQIWIDHIYFESQLNYDRTGDGQDEVGKFIWINTPYESYYDAKDRMRSPDYITISYCHMKNRYWTVAYGTQNDEITRDRTTLLYNWWDENVRRCPQIGNGSGHIYNNYYSAYGVDNNGSGTTGMIGGDGSDIVSQNNRFQGYSLSQALTMGGDVNKNPARDDNSYLSESVSGTPSAINFQSKNSSAWYPNQSNYGYELLDAYNTNGTDTRDFCMKYSGDMVSESDMKYITDFEFSNWINTKYESPFLKQVEFTAPVVSAPASFTENATYRIKNSNSGLYMQVNSAKAENGVNVQQWGTSDETIHDIWKFVDAGDGYYYLVSAVGDGGSYVLDVAGKKNSNGTNIDIYQYNGGDNQKFMLTQNADGSYKILTKISENQSCIEIADAGTGSGDNVQQWEINYSDCQNWILESVANSGCSMNTGMIYEFENKNSGMVLEIESGIMAENTNIQQWTTGHFDSQKWILQKFAGGGNYYYIRSVANQDYVLKAMSAENGGNLAIVPYSSKDSMMLFKFSKNLDGSYCIMTRASKDNCLLEIENASVNSGANVQQWEPNGNDCQKWNIITEKMPDKTENIIGDIDQNGKIEVLDLVLLQKYLHNQQNFSQQQFLNADINQDNIVNIYDFVLLKKLILK